MKTNPFLTPDQLLPAIIQHADTGQVLMLGYMNEEAFAKTKKEGRVTFFSRRKQRLWTKGETSGNFLKVQSYHLDCDRDTLLLKVIPAGPVCHNGTVSCFESDTSERFLYRLEEIIAERRDQKPESSYTSSLFSKGIPKTAQKVGEEAVELVIEAMGDDEKAFTNEAADLLFHFLVLLQSKNVSIMDIEAVLKDRHAEKSGKRT